MIKSALRFGLAAVGTLALSTLPAAAQSFTLDLGDGGTNTGRIIQLMALITVLSLAPSILVMVTSFTRIVVVLSFLRNAIGLQQTPPNAVIISLALFLTAFIMAPTAETAYRDGIAPLMENKLTEAEALERTM
jgi:flagellar biosynthetic protein FliP